MGGVCGLTIEFSTNIETLNYLIDKIILRKGQVLFKCV